MTLEDFIIAHEEEFLNHFFTADIERLYKVIPFLDSMIILRHSSDRNEIFKNDCISISDLQTWRSTLKLVNFINQKEK